MIRKSRQISDTLYGEKPILYHNVSSWSGLEIAYQRGWDQHDVLMDFYREYKELATSSRAGCSYAGTEVFKSTERQRPQFNNCWHTWSGGINYPFSMCHYDEDRNGCHLLRFYRQSLSSNLSVPPTLQQHHEVGWQPARSRAWHVMQPRFEGDISMFNFLLELKDLKELYSVIRKLKPQRLKRSLLKLRRKRYIDPSRPLAEAHLMNEFAIKPLISDFVTILSQINIQVLEAQKDFQEAGLGRNTRHYTEVFDVDWVSDWSSYYENKYPYRGIGLLSQLVFTATMEYSYAYSMRSTLDAVTRYWGLTPTWNAIWNAIPFSFLLDYVFKVGDSIKAMEHDKNVDLELTQYCESLLSTVEDGRFYYHDWLLNDAVILNGRVVIPKRPLLVSGTKSSFYTRRVTTPNKGMVLPKVTLPNSKQGRNFAALLRCFF